MLHMSYIKSLSLIFIYPSIYLCTYLSIHEFILISNCNPEVLGTFLPFLPLAVTPFPTVRNLTFFILSIFAHLLKPAIHKR